MSMKPPVSWWMSTGHEDCPFEATYDDALNAACEPYDVEVGSLIQPLPVVYANTLFKVFSTPTGTFLYRFCDEESGRRPHRSERRGPSRRAPPEAGMPLWDAWKKIWQRQRGYTEFGPEAYGKAKRLVAPDRGGRPPTFQAHYGQRRPTGYSFHGVKEWLKPPRQISPNPRRRARGDHSRRGRAWPTLPVRLPP